MGDHRFEVRCLLLQVRNPDDPMREHEIESFARVLGLAKERIHTLDLLRERVTPEHLRQSDLLLLGGSGDYSVAGSGAWLDRALDSLRRVHDSGQPTFASCWGFQAMARALGGRVELCRERGEIGTHELFLTEAGSVDPIFAPLGPRFRAQMGHEDVVFELPPRTTLLASSDLVENQAYRFDDLPIYCTQFHPELRGSDLMVRFRQYPKYVEELAHMPLEAFERTLEETPAVEGLLTRFVALLFPDGRPSACADALDD